ncbi:MAG TPA: hypothetical protein VGF70_09310 [Solirubrobacteraceae bacterium]|jgi:hypothetical protein
MRRLALTTTLACAVAAPVALATTSNTKFWQNPKHTAVCGKRIGQRSFQLLCSAKGIPRPKSGGSTGDPFVVLGKTGRPKIVLLSQREFPAGNPKTLANHSDWAKNGISCGVSQKVICSNTSNHGFVIGDGKYKTF